MISWHTLCSMLPKLLSPAPCSMVIFAPCSWLPVCFGPHSPGSLKPLKGSQTLTMVYLGHMFSVHDSGFDFDSWIGIVHPESELCITAANPAYLPGTQQYIATFPALRITHTEPYLRITKPAILCRKQNVCNPCHLDSF